MGGAQAKGTGREKFRILRALPWQRHPGTLTFLDFWAGAAFNPATFSERLSFRPAYWPWRPEANARQRCAPSGAKVFGRSLALEVVIARLDRAIQYPRGSSAEPRCRGVLDAPVKPGHDDGERGNPARAGQGTTALFDNLSERLGGILDRLTGRGALTEKDVDAAMREVRRALLEADVALEVVRSFTEPRPRAGDRRHRRQIGHARPDGGQDRP
ncbi:hypothetical protein ACVWXQ_006075 [Bradyrhizobium sp. S3.14.4]